MELYLDKSSRVVAKPGVVDTFELQVHGLSAGWRSVAWGTRLGAVLDAYLTCAMWRGANAPGELTLGQALAAVARARDELAAVVDRATEEVAEVETNFTAVRGIDFDDL